MHLWCLPWWIWKHSCVLLFSARISLTLFLWRWQRWGNQHAITLHGKHQSLTRFLAYFKKKWPTNQLFMPVALPLIVSFEPMVPSWISFVAVSSFLEKHFIPPSYHWLTSSGCSNCLSQCFCQSDCYFGCDKTVHTCSYIRTLRFLILYSCAYLRSLGKFGFRPVGIQNETRLHLCLVLCRYCICCL